MAGSKIFGRLGAGAAGAAAVLFGATCASHAAMISVHFIGGGGGFGSGSTTAVDSGGAAGVVPQTGHWNNLDVSSMSSNTFDPIIDSTGATAKLGGNDTTVSFTSGYTIGGGSAVSFGTTEDQQLFAGGIGGDPLTVSLANVPYASYDVYVYSRGFQTGSISDGTTTYYATGLDNSGYKQYTATTPGDADSGNYSVFHETSSSATFTATDSASPQLFGIQIVETAVPEPGSMSLLSLGAISLLRRRR